MFTDLVGEQIFEDDWYFSIWHGEVLSHKFVEGWGTDIQRLSTGRVVKHTMGKKGMTREKALAIFKEHGIENT